VKDNDRKVQILKQIKEGHHSNGVSIYRNCGTVERYIDLKKRLQNEFPVPHDLEEFAAFIEFLRDLRPIAGGRRYQGSPTKGRKR